MTSQQILQPSVSIAITSAAVAAQNAAQKVLMVGQMTTGSASAGNLVSNIGNASEEDALFGQNSMLAGMVRAFKKINKIVQLDAIPLADAAGTARVVTATFAGTATAAGSVTVVAGSEKLYKFTVSVASGDSASTVHANLVAAINANLDCPFTAGGVAPALALTADNVGTVMNNLGIEVLVNATGITVASLVETAAGATDPTLTSVLDVATDRYQGIVWPYPSGSFSVLTGFLDARLNPTNDILDGVGFVSLQDTSANLITALNALNKQDLVVFVDESISEANVYLGPAQNEASYVKLSIFAAIRALRLTQDASISQFVTSQASSDQFGGTALASLPYFNTPLADLPTIKQGRGFTQTEIESLLTAGGAVMGVNKTGTGALVGEVPTTYKTDAAANPDPTFKFLNLVDTISNVREYFFNNYKKRFAQTRLTQGSVSRGRDMANKVIIEAYTDQLYQDLAGPNFVLVQDGEDVFEFFKNNRTVVLDLATGKVTITMQVPVVTQLRTIIATIQVAFSTEG